MKQSPVLQFVYFWFVILLFSACFLEVGCAAGGLPDDVLASVCAGASSWWGQPAWLHVLAALLLTGVLVWSTALFTAPGVPAWKRLSGGVAAVSLSTPLSPLYLAVPFFPLAGTLVTLIVLAGLLRAYWSRNLWISLLPDSRGDRILWGLMSVLVLVAIFNQFDEMKRVVSRVTDFGMFYDAATALTSGGGPYDATDGGYFYPPTFAYYLRLLTWLPKAGASLLWFTLKLALLAWTYHAVFRLVGGLDTAGTRRRWLIFGMVFVAARFVFSDLQYGNTNTFVLWLAVAAIVFDLEDRPVLSGLSLAGAVSIKVVPAVFVVYFLVRGRLRVLASTMLWLFVLNAAPVLMEGRVMWDAWSVYLETGVAGKLGGALAQPDNQSLWGVLNRSFAWPLSTARYVWVGLSLALSAVAAWAAYSLRRGGPARQAGAASLFFLLGLLVSPGSWVVHYCAVLLPMTFLLVQAMKNIRLAPVVWAVFLAANVAFTFSGWFRPTVRWSIEQSWFAAAALLLFIALTWLSTRQRAESHR